MTETFNPPRKPTLGSSRDVEPRVLEVEFGDGYTAVSPDGINTVLQSRSVLWNGLSDVDRAAIETFFEARAGVQRFYYQFPGDAKIRLWRCKTWSVVDGSPDSMTAQWVEEVMA